MESIFLENIHHAYAQTDGTYAFPNSREGDLLRLAKKEIEELLHELAKHKHVNVRNPSITTIDVSKMSQQDAENVIKELSGIFHQDRNLDEATTSIEEQSLNDPWWSTGPTINHYREKPHVIPGPFLGGQTR